MGSCLSHKQPLEEGFLLSVVRPRDPLTEQGLRRGTVIDHPHHVLKSHDPRIEPLAKTRIEGNLHDLHRVAELLGADSEPVKRLFV